MADDLRGDVLVVDDAPENLRVLAMVLTRGGHVPRPVRSGRLAIEAAVASPPDLVILDVNMPEMSGLDVARRFKQDEGLRSIPIIFISGIDGVSDKVAAFRAGGVDFISKPFQEQEVLARVNTHLQLRRLQLALEAQNVQLTLEQRQAQERLQVLSSAARDALIMLDHESRISHWNEAAEEMFGWTRAEVLGHSLHALLAPQRLQGAYDAGYRQFRDTGQGPMVGKTVEVAACRRSGEEFPVEISLAGTKLNGKWCAVGIVRDITDRKRAEERLRSEIAERQRVEVELRHSQKLEAVGQLAAGIAHEINTPTQFVGDSVRFIKEAFEGLVSLLPKYRAAVQALGEREGGKRVSEEIRAQEQEIGLDFLLESVPDSLERCLDGMSRIGTIVRSMKEFAHADEREQSPADINRAIDATLVIARNEYRYVAEVKTDLGEIPPVVCHLGDLNQVFLNLVVNAAHAISDVVKVTGTKGTIHASTRSEGEWVRIDIADSGTGIPEALRERIFEPFFTTKPVGKGTGQGLAIARAIVVDRHGGSLTFESTTGKGTTFTIRLPITGKPKAREEGAA